MSVSVPLVPTAALTRSRRAAKPEVDAVRLAKRLAAEVRGEVRFDPGSLALYAHDASNYRRVPIGVVVPEDANDVIATVEACRAHGAPIVARGGGTALAGQTVNEAVVLDFSKRMNRILAIDTERRRARVEPGVVCDALVDATAPHGLTWGPKPATHSRCCFGGMLANNCGGMHAQWNGTAVHNTHALDVLLADGTRLELGWIADDELRARRDRLARRIVDLRDRYAARIRDGFPQFGRRISGYNLDQLLPDASGQLNLARVIVGSECTLGLMLSAELELLEDLPERAVVVLGYEDVFRAADAVPSVLECRPIGLEGIDDLLVKHIRTKGGLHARHLELLCRGGGWLIVEIGGHSKHEVSARAAELVARMDVVDSVTYLDRAQQRALFDAREGGLGSTAFVPGEPDTWPGWEDSAVPPERLGTYLRAIRRLFDAYDYHPALYGHFGMGVVHCRVPFDLYDAHGVRKFRSFLSDAADLVVAHGGSLSGEHGDGQARAELLEKMFGKDLVEAMRELKAIFDPTGMMNPGKIVDPYPIVDHLKLYPDGSNGLAAGGTHFRYPDDGGSFSRATLRCVGVGKCRRTDAGDDEHSVMCPSYMVTHEEKHSTRGRAHLLFEMLRGDGPVTEGWHDDAVRESLDLCLACKGCKSDCPVNVDVATYKAEFLSHYYEGRLRPRHAYAFGLVDRAARLAALAPGLANLVTQTPGLRDVAKLAAGIASDAQIPPFAPETFRSWFSRRKKPHNALRRALLFVDTFNDHFTPEVLAAATRVLEATGYEVHIPRRRVCCGRPLYDFGMLDRAKRYLEELLATVGPDLDDDVPVVVLEPSCASVLVDELGNLLPARADAQKLRQRTTTLAALLAKEPLPRRWPRRRAVVQGHCHERAVLGFDDSRATLERVGLDVEVAGNGCCGMAGAFGYVPATRPVGRASGERSLLPRVRSAEDDALVIADGFSCREQIAQHTDRRALHLAEVLAMAIDGDVPPPGERPERASVRRRERKVRGSMMRAAVGLILGVGLVVALARRSRR